MKVACWNTEWHQSSTWQGSHIRRTLLADDPQIVCCPESYEDFLSGDWHAISSRADYGYPILDGRRKVVVWSRNPWQEIDDLGNDELPAGRFVQAVTDTSLGLIRIVGLCVPWRDAHVRNGRRDRIKWEDHRTYLRGLNAVLSSLHPDTPTLILGDFNQRIPRHYAPPEVFQELETAITGYEIYSSGPIAGLNNLPVCHIGGSRHLTCRKVSGYSRWQEKGPVSDHDGMSAEIAFR